MSTPLPPDPPARLTLAHIEELCTLRADARLAAETFTTAVTTLAERYGIHKTALRRYVCAREKDALATLSTEQDDLDQLLELNA